MQLIYWADQAQTAVPTSTILAPNGSGSYVDEKDFTYVSPSVYLAFTYLAAVDQCGTVGTVCTVLLCNNIQRLTRTNE